MMKSQQVALRPFQVRTLKTHVQTFFGLCSVIILLCVTCDSDRIAKQDMFHRISDIHQYPNYPMLLIDQGDMKFWLELLVVALARPALAMKSRRKHSVFGI
jgi:hypothetical protein